MKSLHLLVILAPALGTAGCTHTARHGDRAPPSAAAQPPSDGDAAATAYKQGLHQLERGLTQEAITTFDDLKLTHPYSRFAALSELRAADAYAKRQEYLTAIDGYRSFLRFHPNHDEAPYALEQVGQNYLAQIPQDFWPLPPTAEKDLDATRQAIAAFEELLAQHPQANAERAQRHLDSCRKTLGMHELVVARFYHSRSRWPGALMRAQLVLKDYSGLGFDDEARFVAGSSLMHMGQKEQGKALLQQLVQASAPLRWRREAKRTLAKLDGSP